MAYSTVPKGSLYMNTKLYTGNGSTNAITGVGFQPDWSWLKRRDSADSHALYDAVRGVTKRLEANTTGAEATKSAGLTTFGTDGFTLGNDTQANASGGTYASWNWLGNGSGSANTAGDINSTVSVNTTSGFSIVSYTGTGSAATVGHGLGSVPKMIILKNRDSADVWRVYHKDISATKYLSLDSTAAAATASSIWNDTEPTSAVFSIGTHGSVNGSGQNIIAYCFADVTGYSKFGSYVGTGSDDGSFIYTGFSPAFVMVKKSSATNNWVMTDNKRNPSNVATNCLFANLSDAEGVGLDFDLLSNGFKLRSNSGGTNTSGETYVYMAFAENPFVATSGTAALPVTAR